MGSVFDNLEREEVVELERAADLQHPSSSALVSSICCL